MSLLRGKRWWTEKACQAGIPTCAKKRDWRDSICREHIRIGVEIESQDGVDE